MKDWLMFDVTVTQWAKLYVKAGAVILVLLQLMALVFLLTLAARLAWYVA